MKRHPALVPLSQDHHKVLLLAQLIKKNAPEYHGLPTDLIDKMDFAKETYHKELVHHFKDEEQFVFPNLKGKDSKLDNLIAEIMNEHIILKEKILSLNDNQNLVDELDEIGRMLDEHVRKEERILFEKAQEILSEQELEEIKNKFDLTRPQSKTCIK